MAAGKAHEEKGCHIGFLSQAPCLFFTDLMCSLLETPSEAALIAARTRFISFLLRHDTGSEERRYDLRSEESMTPGMPRRLALSEANTASGTTGIPSGRISLRART